MQVTIPTLRTERLDLVPPHYSHLATYEALYGSPEVMRHIAEPIDKQAAARLLAAHAGSWVLHGFGGWCVEERATRAVIGIAGLKRLEQGEDVEVGWIIEPSAWGRGYATEAAREVIQYAFEQIGALRAVAHIAPENAGSIAVARKLGMQLEQEAAVGTALIFVRNRELALEAYPPLSRLYTTGESPMLNYEFIAANVASHRAELIELNVEYLAWVFAGIEEFFEVPADEVVGMPVRDYVPGVIDKVCGDPPPKGIFYLVKVDHTLAGMGGLRFLRPGVAEIKRIYFRPEFRGRKLGELMLIRLLADAKAFGYQSVCLDTAVFMQAAHRLYEKNGFSDCSAYEGVEVPAEFHGNWRFMERQL